MAKFKLNYELLPVKLHYFTFYGGIGALWPFLQVIARQWGISGFSIGWIFALATLIGTMLTPLITYIASRLQKRKVTFLLFLLINLVSFITLALLPMPNSSRTNKFTPFDRPVQLACDETSPKMQLYLRQCRSSWLRNSDKISCYTQHLNQKYFEGYDDDVDDDDDSENSQNEVGDWFSASEELTKGLPFETCDVHCSLEDQNIDVCDFFDEPQKCQLNSNSNAKGRSKGKDSLVELRGNVTFIKFQMTVEVSSIKRNSSCLHLPLQLISFNGKRLLSSCPGSSGSAKSSESIVMPHCSVNCVKNKGINALLESYDNNSNNPLDHHSEEFWAFTLLICTSVTCLTITSLFADGFCFELLLGKNGNNNNNNINRQKSKALFVFGLQKVWGLIGGGVFALASGYMVDFHSEHKPLNENEISFYLSSGLLILNWILSLYLKVNDYTPSDSISGNFIRLLKQPKQIVFLAACLAVGFCAGLQSNFQLWYMEDIMGDIDNSENKCDWAQWIKLSQGSLLAVEFLLGELPIYFIARSILRRIQPLNCMTLILAVSGLRFLLTSFITNPWALVPFGLLQGVTSSTGLFYFVIISNELGFRKNAKMQNKSFRLVPSLMAPLTFKGLGVSIGSMVSGILLENESSQIAFRIFGVTALASAVIYAVILFVFKILSDRDDMSKDSVSDEDEVDCEKEEESEEMVGKENKRNWQRKESKPETIRSGSTIAEWKEATETTAMKKFKLLLWKNFKIQTRHKFQTVIEIMIPLVFTMALAAVRMLIPLDKVSEPTIFEPFTLKGNVPPVIRILTDEIFYTPSSPFFDELMGTVQKNYFTAQGLNYTFISFPSEKEMVKAYESSMEGFSVGEGEAAITAYNATAKVLAGVTFEKFSGNKIPKNIKYTLRFPAYQRTEFEFFSERFTFKPAWFTESIYPLFRLLGPRSNKANGGFPGYFAEGFLYLQYAIDTTLTKNFLSKSEQKELDDYDIKMQRFPYPPYTDDKFVFAIQFWMPFFLTLSFIYPCMNITKVIVYEKECRLKEFMKMMGLPNWLHWTAWFIKAFLFILGSLILLTLLVKIQFKEDRAILTESNALVIFVVLLCHSISLIGFCFFMSTLYSSANSAATAAGFIWLMFFLPYGFFFPRMNIMSRQTKYLTCILLANSPISYALLLFATFEGTAAGMQWDLIATGVTPDDSFCIMDCMIMMLANGIFYMIAAFYIEIVWPGKYGVPLPWYFPFTKWYWTGGAQKERENEKPPRTPTRSLKKAGGVSTRYFEVEPPNLKAGIYIQGLTKVFGKKTAVNGLNLKMFENQITALLGHNGAGKTTTMSMLTGLLTPSRGTALINDHDICKEMKSVRANLGMCPQYDVLFDELTVEEHLKFFSLLKGYDEFEADAEVERMLQSLGFEAKREAQAHTLSGGMKRKLSVGIAFCAGSKAVLLDEPTSGMDPGARRSTWDLIQTEKMGRTVVLSTHFMEEADLLGDRIAIMAEGEVQCCGSSLFLKKKYGGDYRLIIVKEPDCHVEDITSVLKNKIPAVHVSQDVGAELSYSLPDESSKEFPELFEELERRKGELGIASYGVGNTTIEEVFMRVCESSRTGFTHGHDSLKSSKSRNSMKNSHSRNSELSRSKIAKSFQTGTTIAADSDVEERKLLKFSSTDAARNTGSKLKMQQFKGMLAKKTHFALRNRNLLLLQIGIPVALLFIAVLAVKNVPAIMTPKPHLITLDRYETLGETVTAVSCETDAKICNGYRSFVTDKYNIEEIRHLSFLDFIMKKETEDLPKTSSTYMVGLEQRAKFGDPKGRSRNTELTAFFNNQPFHTPPLALNFLTNAILRAFKVPHQITVTNHPFDYNSIDSLKQGGNFFTMGFMVGWSTCLGISFLAASFIMFPIQERITKAKHLQFVAGVKFPIYWAAAYLMDVVNYMVSSILVLLLLIVLRVKEYYEIEIILAYLSLSLAHGWAQISLMSLLSFSFSIPSSGYARMVAFNAGTGMLCMIVVIILGVPEFDIGDLTDTLHNIFLIVPNYSFGMGIVQLQNSYDLHQYCTTFDLENFCKASKDFVCCTKYHESYMAWEPFGLGRNVVALCVFGCVCTILLTVIESRIFQKVLATCQWQNDWETAEDFEGREPLDDDVEQESQRINSQTLAGLSRTDNLILRNLTKNYDGKFLAVDRLTLGIRRGETFGLLGVNGAGKTTTFKMLTGDIPITHGDAYLCTYSVRKKAHKVHENLGYCPQFDAVIEQLTGRETIRMFARLKGIKEESIEKIVDRLGENLLFTEHIEKQVGDYSGGNKRKLSTALAMLGNPSIVFLDEPTTGMDPVARRHVWNAVSGLREMGTSVVITSHSMEECEALCSKLSIMVNGRFQCLGSPQHLKNKFGEGYTIVAQLNYTGLTSNLKVDASSEEEDDDYFEPWELELTELKIFIEKEFTECELKDSHPGFVQYHVSSRSGTWARLFAVMERAKEEFNLEAYSVGQTSLEQVFFNFTKIQKSSDD